ncbi:MAG TPA: TetR/AcrR family transcriptional regulator [Longimicrobiaceae bacterium]|nr:TetR/AcrR family transcriptional regulator [Longimicrobiaceae bacterium]
MTDRDQDTEQRILDAAHTVFLRRGTAGARMQEIADEAGVNKALLHYYFRSKERMAEAVFQRAARRLFPPVLAILASDDAIEAKVERTVAHYLDTLAETPFLPGYVLAELQHHPERITRTLESLAGAPVQGLGLRVFARLAEQIEERVRDGTLRPILPDQFVVNLLSLCIFPFAARPMLEVVLGLGPDGFDAFIRERKRTLPGFFLNALRP